MFRGQLDQMTNGLLGSDRFFLGSARHDDQCFIIACSKVLKIISAKLSTLPNSLLFEMLRSSRAKLLVIR